VEDARNATLQHFNAPVGEYAVVFTSGATAALRLVAESFPWTPMVDGRGLHSFTFQLNLSRV